MKDFKYAVVLVAILASFAVFAGFDPDIELKDSKAVQQGQCKHAKKVYDCFGVVKNDSKYLVAVDQKGVVAVYSVTEFKATYTVEDTTLVWKRKVYTRNDV